VTSSIIHQFSIAAQGIIFSSIYLLDFLVAGYLFLTAAFHRIGIWFISTAVSSLKVVPNIDEGVIEVEIGVQTRLRPLVYSTNFHVGNQKSNNTQLDVGDVKLNI
jgi:hypothetical protein